MTGRFLDELESRLFIDASGVDEDAVGPQHHFLVAGQPGEAIDTQQGRIESKRIVVALGPWSGPVRGDGVTEEGTRIAAAMTRCPNMSTQAPKL